MLKNRKKSVKIIEKPPTMLKKKKTLKISKKYRRNAKSVAKLEKERQTYRKMLKISK